MDKQNLMPHQAQPVARITTGQLPTELTELTELTEEILGSNASESNVLASMFCLDWFCSYDGDDAE